MEDADKFMDNNNNPKILSVIFMSKFVWNRHSKTLNKILKKKKIHTIPEKIGIKIEIKDSLNSNLLLQYHLH